MSRGRLVGALHQLKARFVETSSKTGKYADGGGLYLFVRESTSAKKKAEGHPVNRKWVFLYRLNGKRHEMGLGPAGKGGVSLAQARERAAMAREQLLDVSMSV